MWQKYKPNELSKSPESKLKDIYTQIYNNQTAKKKKKKKNPKDMDKEKLKSNHRKTTNYFKGKTTLMTADFSLKIIEVRKILNRY